MNNACPAALSDVEKSRSQGRRYLSLVVGRNSECISGPLRAENDKDGAVKKAVLTVGADTLWRPALHTSLFL